MSERSSGNELQAASSVWAQVPTRWRQSPRPLSHLTVVAVGALSVVGCSDHGASEAAAGSASQSIRSTGSGVVISPDGDTAQANTVVALGAQSCTGTLITPRIVLTAAHCPQPSTIGVGINASAAVWFNVSDSVALSTPTPPAKPPADSDLRIVYLRDPVHPGPFRSASVTAPSISFPTLAPPGANEPTGVSGYSDANEQNVHGQVVFRRFREWSDGDRFEYDSGIFTQSYRDNWGMQRGDSGGPAYTLRAGVRDVFGVLTRCSRYSTGPGAEDWECNGGPGPVGPADHYSQWTSITSPVNKTWLLDHVRENNVPVFLQHKPGWLDFHGKKPDSKWGEADYTGHCLLDVDPDCDGWSTHDNCPNIPNPLQKDRDGDNIGDECDTCPFDPKDDADRDGWCGDGTEPDVGSPLGLASIETFDNCPTVPQRKDASDSSLPSRDNCNVLIEVAERQRKPHANIKVLGDACDPVPCPSPAAQWSKVPEFRIPNRWVPVTTEGRAKLNSITVAKLQPREKTKGTPQIAYKQRTLARFCQATPSDLDECRRNANIDEIHRDAFDSAAAELPDRNLPWLRVTLPAHSPNPNQEWEWTYDDGQDAHTWSYQSDYDRWKLAKLIPLPGPNHPCKDGDEASGAATCLGGTLWYSVRSSIGAADHAPGITDGYIDLAPDFAYRWSYPGIHVKILEFNVADLRDPYPCPDWMLHVAPISFDRTTGELLLVEDNGAARDISEYMTTGAKELLASKPSWAGAVEPSPLVSHLDARLQSVAVSPDGTHVLGAMLLDRMQLKTAADLGIAITSPADVGRNPMPRSEFTTFLSLNVGGVFIIGGRDATSADLLNEVHLFRFGVGWTSVTPSVKLAQVEAAVYSPTDKRLWLLDRPDADKGRLVMVDPWTGNAKEMDNFARDGANSLALDRDGRALLTRASKTAGATTVQKLQLVDGKLSILLNKESLPYSSDPLVVANAGYGVIVRAASDGAVEQIVRVPSFNFQ